MESLPGRVARMITRVVGTAAGIFYQVDSHGPPLPEGPVLVAVNHPNSLVDPLLVFRCSERLTRPLARSPLFDQLLLGPVLRALGGIPVYRRQDDPDAMYRNEGMFRDAIGVLVGGGAIQIYPEGRSHSEAHVVELRTGAARIALQAEEAANWKLGLSIVPVGITYTRKERARTAVAVRFGRAFGCARLEDVYREDPVAAVRTLTEQIEAGIRAQTLNFVHHGDRALVEVAEQLYVRESRWVPWRTREELGTRVPRLQRFAAGLEWVRRELPDEHRALLRKVERYAALNARVGAGQGDVPPRYGLVPVARYIAVRGTLLLAGLPFAIAGILLWAPVTRLPRIVISVTRPDFEVTATYKLLALMTGSPRAGPCGWSWDTWLGGPCSRWPWRFWGPCAGTRPSSGSNSPQKCARTPCSSFGFRGDPMSANASRACARSWQGPSAASRSVGEIRSCPRPLIVTTCRPRMSDRQCGCRVARSTLRTPGSGHRGGGSGLVFRLVFKTSAPG